MWTLFIFSSSLFSITNIYIYISVRLNSECQGYFSCLHWCLRIQKYSGLENIFSIKYVNVTQKKCKFSIFCGAIIKLHSIRSSKYKKARTNQDSPFQEQTTFQDGPEASIIRYYPQRNDTECQLRISYKLIHLGHTFF